MSDIVFEGFGIQNKILRDDHRIIGAFAGKRSGKTEVGAIKSILWQEEKEGHNSKSVDPFLGVIMAPTFDMLRRLSLKKFMAYAEPFIKDYNKSTAEITWHDGSIIYGLSADNPERIEGIKANWIWLDEVFQMSEQLWLEARARTADSRGKIIATGSLGVQFINPKQHWAHYYFKEKPDKNTVCYEWGTKDNPYFPQDELENLKEVLDPISYRAMFEINWDTVPKSAVYADFDNDNVIDNYVYNPDLPTYVSIDWGWSHPMACIFFQYDRRKDVVYIFDEIISSKLKLEGLYAKIKAKPYKITDWCCDISGNQEREQTGLSNCKWFHINHDISFKYRKSTILVGIALVRSYVKNSNGQRKLYISSSCKKSIDGMRQYRYQEKDGAVVNENPIKENDDAVDAIRYFFMNFLDRSREFGEIKSIKGM